MKEGKWGKNMVDTFHIKENRPFPNNELPVLYWPKAVEEWTNEKKAGQKVLALFEKNGYTNGWVNGIFPYHHFHSNTHEVLACIAGEAKVQLGGPDAETYTFAKGDVLLLPAGVAHKRLEATADFQIVGAYPNGQKPDMQKGDTESYEDLKHRALQVKVPETDPLDGAAGAVQQHWENEAQ